MGYQENISLTYELHPNFMEFLNDVNMKFNSQQKSNELLKLLNKTIVLVDDMGIKPITIEGAQQLIDK